MATQTRTTFRMVTEDRNGLIHFLDTLKEVLDTLVKSPDLVIPTKFHRSLKASWKLVLPTFKEIKSVIRSGHEDERLKAVGLTGDQLHLKLSLCEAGLVYVKDMLSQVGKEHTSFKTPPPSTPFQKERFRWIKNRLRWGLKLFLKPSNVVLGSLAKVIQLAEILHELKGIVEGAIDHADFHEEMEREKQSKAPTSKQWEQVLSQASAFAKITSILPPKKKVT